MQNNIDIENSYFNNTFLLKKSTLNNPTILLAKVVRMYNICVKA